MNRSESENKRDISTHDYATYYLMDSVLLFLVSASLTRCVGTFTVSYCWKNNCEFARK